MFPPENVIVLPSKSLALDSYLLRTEDDIRSIIFPWLGVSLHSFEQMMSIGHETNILMQLAFCHTNENVRLAHLTQMGAPRFDRLMSQRIVLYISMDSLS